MKASDVASIACVAGAHLCWHGCLPSPAAAPASAALWLAA